MSALLASPISRCRSFLGFLYNNNGIKSVLKYLHPLILPLLRYMPDVLLVVLYSTNLHGACYVACSKIAILLDAASAFA
jgi:hypothetical protein